MVIGGRLRRCCASKYHDILGTAVVDRQHRAAQKPSTQQQRNGPLAQVLPPVSCGGECLQHSSDSERFRPMMAWFVKDDLQQQQQQQQ